MSRRPLPSFRPGDLRDPADPARVDRIWERLEASLPSAADGARARRPLRAATLLVAATLSAFAGGVVVGRGALRVSTPAPVAAVPSGEGATAEVLAAGTRGRSYPLPGGGSITLAPGSTVELVRTDADALTMRLVQGAADVDTNHAVAGRDVSIVAGDARLATQAGSVLSVRRADEHLDVTVASGEVRLTSPAGSQRLGVGDHAEAVPLHAVLASAPSPRSVAPSRRRALPSSASAPDAGAAPTLPEWKQRWLEGGDYSEAFKLLKQQPGGAEGAIASARSAEELMAIRDLARYPGGDTNVAISALNRVVSDFPGRPEAAIAARELGELYERMGKPEEAAAYRQRAQSLSPSGFWGDDTCARIRAELRKGRTDEGARAAQEYLSKFPDGQCKDDAERLLRGDDAAPADAAAPATSGRPDAGPPR